jgi:acetate kinase
VKKYIGEYAAVTNGVDAVIFTAGIGENNEVVRKGILTDIEYLGIKIDWEKNEMRGKELDISTPDATVRTLVIPTNEELAIARETFRLIKS